MTITGFTGWVGDQFDMAWAGGGGLVDGAGNILYGGYMLIHDLVTMPIDLVMTTYGCFDTTSRWEQLSYFGSDSLAALQGGTPLWQIQAQTAAGVVTLGMYGFVTTGYEWYVTGDPRSFQQYTGMFATGTFLFGYASGVEIAIGRNFRVAPFGNRTGHPTGRYPHYHRRGPHNPLTNETAAGQGIGRHRPWDIKSIDTTFGDRF